MTQRFTSINGLSEIRQLPRLGKIRGGVRVKKKKPDSRCNHPKTEICFYCSYPKETPHFVVPADVATVYGDKPTELDIMLPLEDIDTIFPCAYKMYGSGRGLKCTGDGKTGLKYSEATKAMEPCECPCEHFSKDERSACSQRGHLMFILPKVSVGGVFQLDTSSYHTIVSINSSLDYIKALAGRFAMIPLKLKREPKETHHNGQKQTHYVMRIELEGGIDFLNTLRHDTQRVLAGPQYRFDPPTEVAPAYDGNAYIDEESLPAIEAETTPEEALSLPLKDLLAKIDAIKSSGDIASFREWSDANKSGIIKLPTSEQEQARTAFIAREKVVLAAEKASLVDGFKKTLESAKTVASLNKTMEAIEGAVEAGEDLVKLRMIHDRRVQEIKGSKK